MRKFMVSLNAQSKGGKVRKQARRIETKFGRRPSTEALPLQTALRETCQVCRSRDLDDAFVGPWVVCVECRQVQSRYALRAPRPNELAQEPRYNLNEDFSELE